MSEPQTAPPGANPAELGREILSSTRAIEQQLRQLNGHPFIAVYDSTSRMLLLQFLKGAAFGLGSVAGAGIILSLVVYLLSQVQFVPILGELVKNVLVHLQQTPP